MVKDKKTGQIRFVYKYLEKDGYGLPVDLSQNKFWNKIRLSNEFGKGVYRQKLSDIINTVSCNKEQNIYHDIYESTADRSNFSEYEDDDDSVGVKKPEHFFFETVDLLRAIVVAYNQCNDASGEKLAKTHLLRLASSYLNGVMRMYMRTILRLHFSTMTMLKTQCSLIFMES